jgi:hypothetical protein
MLLKFLAFLRESPFIEGMGRVLDFLGVINTAILPVKSELEALKDDWIKVQKDFRHSIIVLKVHENGKKKKNHH